MTTTKHMVKLGETGPEILRIGLGCMGMSGMYGPTEEAESVATIQHAIERGVRLLDTGDFYGMGHNERLVGKAIAGRRDGLVISVKFGALRAPGGAWLGVDTRPAAVKNFAAYSLDRLGVDAIDVYRPARLDPNVPIEDTVGAIGELIDAGHVKHVGLSEVGADTIRRAAAVRPIADLQIEYALVTRGPEAKIFPALREVGASATLYGVFSRGLLTGSRPSGPRDYRQYLPRFTTSENQTAVDAFAALARELDRTPAQLALGWVLAKQPGFVPLIGAKTRRHVDDALDTLERPLADDELAAVEKVMPASAIEGTRYAAPQMAHLDSER
ncbi:MAG: aldo/keto reductase [Myxococcales bacterium]|nr:aldo/keto reductase [Myxococcales bacterium]